jgi:hypothetical protein
MGTIENTMPAGRQKKETWFQRIIKDKFPSNEERFSDKANDGKNISVNKFELSRFKKEFKNEKELSDFFKDNIELFLKEIDGGELVSVEQEFSVIERVAFSPRTARADFYIVSTKGNYLVEMKSPQGSHDLFGAIGQLLRYKNDLENRGLKIDEYFLVSDKFDVSFSEVVSKNKLPISVCVLRKQFRLYQRNHAN